MLLEIPNSSTDALANQHVLAITIGNEILRMKSRFAAFPAETIGLSQLNKSIERMEAAMNNEGYEIINLANQPYSIGMTVQARFIPSDVLSPGEKIISKIIKPQINYKGILVQMSEVEVTFRD